MVLNSELTNPGDGQEDGKEKSRNDQQVVNVADVSHHRGVDWRCGVEADAGDEVSQH